MASKDEMTLCEVVAGLCITLNNMESEYERWHHCPSAEGPEALRLSKSNPIKEAIDDIRRFDKRIGDFAEKLRQEVYLPVSGDPNVCSAAGTSGYYTGWQPTVQPVRQRAQ